MNQFTLISAQGVRCIVEEEPTTGWPILSVADFLAIRAKNPSPSPINGPMTSAEVAEEKQQAAKFVAGLKRKKDRQAAAAYVAKYRNVLIPDGSGEWAVMTWADIAEIRKQHNTQCHFVATYRLTDRMQPQEEPLYARVSAHDEAHAKTVTAHAIRESVARLNGVAVDSIQLVAYWATQEIPDSAIAC
jgi:hypothetical protein